MAEEKSHPRLSENLIESFRLYPLPEGMSWVFPEPTALPWHSREELLPVSLGSLRAGFRLSQTNFISFLLSEYGISPGQLVPNGWRRLLCLCRWIHNRREIPVFTPSMFSHIFSLKKIPHSPYYFYLATRAPWKKLFSPVNDSDDEWKSHWAWVKATGKMPFLVTWTTNPESLPSFLTHLEHHSLYVLKNRLISEGELPVDAMSSADHCRQADSPCGFPGEEVVIPNPLPPLEQDLFIPVSAPPRQAKVSDLLSTPAVSQLVLPTWPRAREMLAQRHRRKVLINTTSSSERSSGGECAFPKLQPQMVEEPPSQHVGSVDISSGSSASQLSPTSSGSGHNTVANLPPFLVPESTVARRAGKAIVEEMEGALVSPVKTPETLAAPSVSTSHLSSAFAGLFSSEQLSGALKRPYSGPSLAPLAQRFRGEASSSSRPMFAPGSAPLRGVAAPISQDSSRPSTSAGPAHREATPISSLLEHPDKAVIFVTKLSCPADHSRALEKPWDDLVVDSALEVVQHSITRQNFIDRMKCCARQLASVQDQLRMKSERLTEAEEELAQWRSRPSSSANEQDHASAELVVLRAELEEERNHFRELEETASALKAKEDDLVAERDSAEASQQAAEEALADAKEALAHAETDRDAAVADAGFKLWQLNQLEVEAAGREGALRQRISDLEGREATLQREIDWLRAGQAAELSRARQLRLEQLAAEPESREILLRQMAGYFRQAFDSCKKKIAKKFPGIDLEDVQPDGEDL